MARAGKGRAAKGPSSAKVPALEWLAAGLGALVVAALVALLGREAIGARDEVPPILSVAAVRVIPTPAGHVVEVRVANASGQTAAAVQVEGTLGDETAGASIDYVAGRSDARAGLIFSADPRAGGLELRVTGYELP